jgi:DNA-binding LytR/AlgR family response regulator
LNVFSENKGTYIHTFDNRNYLVESTLVVLEQELDAKEFYESTEIYNLYESN